METDELLHRLFDYDFGANREALAIIAILPTPDEPPLKIFGHVVSAQRIWLARFENPQSPSVEPWPTLMLDEAKRAAEELKSGW